MPGWTIVRVQRKKSPKPNSELAKNESRQQSENMQTQLKMKYGAGTNKQLITKNKAKLDSETLELRHEKVPLFVGKLIMQGRQIRGLTQKALASKISAKPQLVGDYESGRGIRDNQMLVKIERVLGIKLCGKALGQPLKPQAKK